MKVRVAYHGIEVETEIPDMGAEKYEKNELKFNANKRDYAFQESNRPAEDVAILIIKASVEAIQDLKEGKV